MLNHHARYRDPKRADRLVNVRLFRIVHTDTVQHCDNVLKPIYNIMDDLPALEVDADTVLPPHILRRTIDHYASFDAGRGCPFQCSFCTIINVQGESRAGARPTTSNS